MTPSPTSKSASTPGKGIEAAKVHTSEVDSRTTTEALVLVPSKGEPRIDSRLLALRLKKKRHQDLFELIKQYERQLLTLGKLLFQAGPSTGSRTGQIERFALLTENQAYFLLTLSRNTPVVVELKLQMVRAFGDARRAAEVRQVEYLPEYHALHDAIKVAAAGSPNEKWLHINANKAMNQLVGIGPGQRATAGAGVQSLLTVGCLLATQAVREGKDGQTVHQRLKNALKPLAGVLALGEAR